MRHEKSRQVTAAMDRRPAPASGPTTIGRYLVDRLGALGVEHVFGIPGDYILQLYKLIEESPIKLVGDDPRGQRRLRGRCVRADSRAGLHLRDVLRGRALAPATASPGPMPRSRR